MLSKRNAIINRAREVKGGNITCPWTRYTDYNARSVSQLLFALSVLLPHTASTRLSLQEHHLNLSVICGCIPMSINYYYYFSYMYSRVLPSTEITWQLTCTLETICFDKLFFELLMRREKNSHDPTLSDYFDCRMELLWAGEHNDFAHFMCTFAKITWYTHLGNIGALTVHNTLTNILSCP